MRELLLRRGVDLEAARQRAKFAYGIVETAGGGLGLLSFGPLAERLGRRGAFAVYQAVALVVVPFTCYVPQTEWQMLCTLPIFGFFTLGIHAGFAIYFPELLPEPAAGDGSGRLFQRRSPGGGAHALALGRIEVANRARARSDRAESVVLGGNRSAVVLAGDQGSTAAGVNARASPSSEHPPACVERLARFTDPASVGRKPDGASSIARIRCTVAFLICPRG